MRKASLVIAYICTGAILLGTIFRFLHFPGGGLLIVLFSGAFATLALPANLFALFQEKKNKLRRIAQVVGTLAAAHIVLLMLFFAQNWAGGQLFLYQGAALVVAFFAFVIAANKEQSEPMQINTRFNVLFFVIVVLLALSCLATDNRNGERDRLVQLSEMQTRHCDSIRKVVDLMYYDLSMDTSSYDDSTRSRAYDFLMESRRVIGYIESVQQDFTVQNNYGINDDTVTTLQDPMDIDLTTFYFIGEDVQNPTGKAVELYAILEDYRKNILHPDVPFFVRAQSTGEDAAQWVKDNFYKATAIEVMTRLTLLKQNIYQAMQHAIEHDLYK